LIVTDDTDMLAVPVDRLLQEEELAIKSFGSIVTPPPYFYGCTILGDGTMAPVIDGQALISQFKTFSRSQLAAQNVPLSRARPVIQAESILVIDDSLTTRHDLSITLEKAGYQVIQARNGHEALAQLALHPEIKTVFCDVEMPQMNGLEFLDQLQKAYGSTAPRVIMLTARSNTQHIQTAHALGAHTYLTKPYLAQELLQVLNHSCPTSSKNLTEKPS
jgi:chemotaxis family two-component system sensor histidine kinase/response regulator PixL